MADLDSFFAKKKDKKKKTVVKVDDVGSLLERKAKKQEEREREGGTEDHHQQNGDDDRSQEDSEWLDYETNTNNRVDGLRIKDMGLEEVEEEVPEPVEGEEKEVKEKEVTKTWGTVEKNDTAPELIPTASEFAAAKSSRYIAPSMRGGGSGPGGKIDLTNQEMFPTFAAAEQIEKHKKDEVKTGAWSTATAPATRSGPYMAPRSSDPWGSARPAGGDRERSAALDAVRAMSATANPSPVRESVAPVRPPHPVEPVLNKSANAYVPPHLRNQ